MVKVMQYFGMKAAEFRAQWTLLSEQDKADLTNGVKDGTLTY